MKYIIAAAQTKDEGDYKLNLAIAERYLSEAALRGAKLILFPELFMSVYPSKTPEDIKLSSAQRLDGPFVSSMRALALRYGIFTVFGMREYYDDSRSYNTTVLVNDKGEISGSYHKTHLYDAFKYKESDHIAPGDSLFKAIDTPFGRIGLLVCYELRFPEVARYEAVSEHADILLIPAAWTKGPGKAAQLRILASARALENNVYTVLCNMCGTMSTGGSCIIGPLGEIIEELGEDEGLILAELDTDHMSKVRSIVPALANRRTDLY